VALADRQHGVVAWRQLTALGLSGSAIHGRRERGLLIPLHRGVYAVGHRRLAREGRWLAAVLAAGDGAVLSHRDAAALHGIRDRPDSKQVIVTAPGKVRSTASIWVRARCVLTDEDTATVRGIPVTSPARTLVDLAWALTDGQLAATLGEADRRGLLHPAAVERALRRVRGRRGQGHARMRTALDAHEQAGAVLTRSELEERLLDLVFDHALPRPLLNAPVAGFEVDALWPAERVVVELDGWAHHQGRAAAARDRHKTNRLQLAGHRVLRFMHGDLAQRPDDVAAAIRGALGR
jgi:very-short-patch-repair endonuclease